MFDLSDFKSVRLLHDRKQRHDRRLYVAEGSRLVLDLMKNNPGHLAAVYATEGWIALHNAKLRQFSDILLPVSEGRLRSLSSLKSTEEVLAVAAFPAFGPRPDKKVVGFSFYLDHVRDPGNLGTILRTADWFGIDVIYHSPGCADPFNNKAVQSSMSSVARVELVELEYDEIMKAALFDEVVSASAGGTDYSVFEPAGRTLVCLGNEANGVSADLLGICTRHVSIPSRALGAESLNVGVAAGILMSRFSNFQ